MRPPLYILAGGKSRRFGADKARALHRGSPLISSIANRLRPATTGEPTVVGGEADHYLDLDLTTIADLEPGQGPLGGLATALGDLPGRHPDSDWLLLVACDLIDPDPAWVAVLAAGATEASAVAFGDERGWQPLFALYHRSLSTVVRGRLGGEDLSLQALLTDVGAQALPTPAGFRHISTPEDLAGG